MFRSINWKFINKCPCSSVVLNQRGQGLMEYMILTGLICVLCMLTVRNFGETIKSKLQQATEKINKTIVIR